MKVEGGAKPPVGGLEGNTINKELLEDDSVVVFETLTSSPLNSSQQQNTSLDFRDYSAIQPNHALNSPQSILNDDTEDAENVSKITPLNYDNVPVETSVVLNDDSSSGEINNSSNNGNDSKDNSPSNVDVGTNVSANESKMSNGDDDISTNDSQVLIGDDDVSTNESKVFNGDDDVLTNESLVLNGDDNVSTNEDIATSTGDDMSFCDKVLSPNKSVLSEDNLSINADNVSSDSGNISSPSDVQSLPDTSINAVLSETNSIPLDQLPPESLESTLSTGTLNTNTKIPQPTFNTSNIHEKTDCQDPSPLKSEDKPVSDTQPNTIHDASSGDHIRDSADSSEHQAEVKAPAADKIDTKDADVETESSIGLTKAELERQNADLISLSEDQKKVIEMLRVELTRKDDDLLATETSLEKKERDLKKVQEDSAKRFQDLKKAYEQANREKESMVIKFAMREKDILVSKKEKEVAEKKLIEANKDKEGLLYKIKTLGAERTRLQSLCDTRAQETVAARKEGDRWKEEVKQMDSKLTAATSKLKAEADAHRETRESLDRTLVQLAELQNSVDRVKAEAKEVIDKQKQEGLKSRRLEQEQEVKLLIDSCAAEELDTLRRKHRNLLEENNELSVKVQTGEKERLGLESSLSALKETANKQKTEIVDLYAKCAELESLRIQLDREIEKCTAKDAEVTRLRLEAIELQADMAACRGKEAELLEFTQKLTDKNVSLQSEYSSTQIRANSLEEEHSRLVKAKCEAEARLMATESRLTGEVTSLTAEVARLQAELTGRLAECTVAGQQAVDARNEVDVLRRQHTARIRELTKELNAAKKRLENLDPDREISPALSAASRTSSNNSLNKQEYQESVSPGLLKPLSPRPSLASAPATAPPVTNGTDKHADRNQNQLNGSIPDSQILVEKIVKLQRACARRQEKLDFLEEHVEQLVQEVKKKNKIIQNYVLNLQPGALASEQSDIHKAVIGQQGGIMSSVYGSKVTDSGMTLELSLEMNKKLTAVLEDILLKNITLKENMNTLGTEIAKISMERNAKS